MTDHQLPLVSLAIPTYNRADNYLKEAVSSALSQTYKNMEIIVSDNCSTDSTELFFKNISDPRLKYFRQNRNIGAINNFNYCLNQAKGDYFLLLQDDDLIDNDFIEVCMRRADFNSDFGIIRTGTRTIDSKGKTITEFPNDKVKGLSKVEYFRAWFACKTAWYLPSTLFSTKRLKEVGGFNTQFQLLSDVVAVVKLEVKFKRLDIGEIKASFRKHPDELTYAAKVKDWADEFLMLLDLICELVPEHENILRIEGKRFFSFLSYNRASAVKSPFKRFIAYIIVFKKYHHLPTFVRNLIYKNPIYYRVRKLRALFPQIKRTE